MSRERGIPPGRGCYHGGDNTRERMSPERGYHQGGDVTREGIPPKKDVF